MNCFFILFLYFFVQDRCVATMRTDGDVINPQEHDILASVREYPSQLHKCSGTFIKPNILLTTAKCLFCGPCQLFVHALSGHLTDNGEVKKATVFNISKTTIHPEYEKYPHKNNIGLIKLSTPIEDANVFNLPTKINEEPALRVYTYRWQFTSDYRDYYLVKLTERTLSNALCSLLLNHYMDYRLICTIRSQSMSLGGFDEGVPLTVQENNTKYIMGIYGRYGAFQSPTAEVYQSVFPFISWINRVIECDFNCDSSMPFPQDTNTTFSNSSVPFIDNSATDNGVSNNENSPAPETNESEVTNSPTDSGSGEGEQNDENSPAPENINNQKQGIAKWAASFPSSDKNKASLASKAF